MNSSHIFQAVEKIASTPSKLEKERLVSIHIDDPAFVWVMKMAYNPLITFGVAETTLAAVKSSGNGSQNFDDDTATLVQNIADRKIVGSELIAALTAEMEKLNEESGQLLRRILLKDMRAGFGANTINKAAPGTIPDFPYMRCSLPAKSNLAKWDFSVGIISQEKADGMFANVDHEETGIVRVTSRQGSEFPLYAMGDFEQEVKDNLRTGTQTHGELLIYVDGKPLPREEGNGVLNSILNGGGLEDNQTIVFFAWDQIPLSEVKPKNKYKVGYAKRFVELLKQTRNDSQGIRLIPTRVVKSKEEAFGHYRELLKLGKEGTILKHPDAIWADSTSKDQVKLKLEVAVDLEIIGFEPGTPGSKYENTLGALVCASSCGKLVTRVNGRTDAMRDDYWQNRMDYLGNVVTVKANSVIQAEGSDIYALFLPVFVEARPDKSEADTLDQVIDQFKAAIQ